MIPAIIVVCLSPLLFDPASNQTTAYWTPCPYYILGEDEPEKPFRNTKDGWDEAVKYGKKP